MVAQPAQAAEVDGQLALTSDYVWRGSTQSRGDLATQAGLRLAAESGWYASAWSSSVEFAPEARASSEFDLALGWGGALDKDWAVDVNVLHYRYPATTVDLDWTEVNGSVTFRDNTWVSLGWSGEALGYEADGVYALAGAKFPLNERFRLEATIAHYFLDNAVLARDGYSHAALSAIWAFKVPARGTHIEARLSAHATDSEAEVIFGRDSAGSRIEAALQASF